MRDFQLFVELRHHHSLDDGQQFDNGERRHAERVTERQRGRHVPADHRAGQHPQLAAETTDEVPDLPTLRSFRTVQPRRAARAGLRAGLAVALAPAEGPLGESAEPFFPAPAAGPWRRKSAGRSRSSATRRAARRWPRGSGRWDCRLHRPRPPSRALARRASALAKATARSSSDASSGTASTAGSLRVATISAVVSGRSCTRTPEARSCQRGAFVRSSVSMLNNPRCR